jgi:hypothetical protein
MSEVEITDETAFEAGSIGKQIAFAVVTLGMYNLYWFYKTSTQLANGTSADIDPTMMTLKMFIPFLGMWQFSNVAESVTDQDGMVLFLLFLFTGVGGWYMVQSGINDVAAS